MDDPNDFVRIEIAVALQRRIPVIPILLDGAKVPKANQLPKELEELSMRQGLDVRHSSFHHDLDKLVRGLKGPKSKVFSLVGVGAASFSTAVAAVFSEMTAGDAEIVGYLKVTYCVALVVSVFTAAPWDCSYSGSAF